MSITTYQALSKAEEILDRLAKSWPKTFEKILEKYPEDEFYIFSFLKKNFDVSPPEYTLYHQPRISRPEPVEGTSLRKVNRLNGTIELIWALPTAESVKLFQEGKIFANPEVASYIKQFIPTSP